MSDDYYTLEELNEIRARWRTTGHVTKGEEDKVWRSAAWHDGAPLRAIASRVRGLEERVADLEGRQHAVHVCGPETDGMYEIRVNGDWITAWPTKQRAELEARLLREALAKKQPVVEEKPRGSE